LHRGGELAEAPADDGELRGTGTSVATGEPDLSVERERNSMLIEPHLVGTEADTTGPSLTDGALEFLDVSPPRRF